MQQPRNEWLEEIQRNLSELIAKSPAADIERNARAMMTQTFSRLDLVTREEFDVQTQLLQRALERIAVLEARLNVAPAPPHAPPPAPTAFGPDSSL